MLWSDFVVIEIDDMMSVSQGLSNDLLMSHWLSSVKFHRHRHWYLCARRHSLWSNSFSCHLTLRQQLIMRDFQRKFWIWMCLICVVIDHWWILFIQVWSLWTGNVDKKRYMLVYQYTLCYYDSQKCKPQLSSVEKLTNSVILCRKKMWLWQ